MRRPSRHRLTLATLVVVASAPATVRAAPPPEPPSSVRELSDPRFPVRRAAEARLEAEGRSAILDAIADRTPARASRRGPRPRRVPRQRDPALAEAADRILRRVEAGAPDAVRASTRLLKIRLERLVPRLLLAESMPGPAEDDENARSWTRANARPPPRGLRLCAACSRARVALLSILETSTDPRHLAGALAGLCPESGDGPDDDGVLETVARAYEASPARFEGVRGLEAAAGGPPNAVLALALALAGRADAVEALGISDVTEADTFTRWLRAHLKRKGMTWGSGAFLDRYLRERRRRGRGGATGPRREAPCSRADRAGALFLAPADARARATLVVDRPRPPRDGGLDAGRARRREGRARAVAVDEGLRSGRLSQRLAWQAEAGRRRPGLVPWR
jgi:hypothetical protein